MALTFCNCAIKMDGQYTTIMAPLTTRTEPNPMRSPVLVLSLTIFVALPAIEHSVNDDNINLSRTHLVHTYCTLLDIRLVRPSANRQSVSRQSKLLL